jgi:hypothetical protein
MLQFKLSHPDLVEGSARRSKAQIILTGKHEIRKYMKKAVKMWP